MTTTILVGDVLAKLAELPDESVQCVLCSPPYLALRDYGLPPSIWGGHPRCEHQFGEALAPRAIPPRPDHSQGVLLGTYGQQAAAGGPAALVSRGSFCIHCGAWRGCLGQEPSVELFIEHLVLIFREVRRVLRPDGVLLVNIGDSYAGSGKGPTGHNGIGNQSKRQGFAGGEHDQVEARHRKYQPDHRGGSSFPIALDRREGRGIRSGSGYELHEPVSMPECKPKDLMLAPERFAIAMQAAGWYVRSRICWAKASAMPESVDDRPTSAWEHVWLFSRSRRYFWDREATRQPLATKTLTHRGGGKTGRQDATDSTGRIASGNWHASNGARQANESGAAMRNFWLLGPEPSRYEYCAACDTFLLGPERKAIARVKGPDGKTLRVCPACESKYGWVAHFAAFPTELVRRCLLGGTSAGGACATCAAPRKRIVERSYANPGNRSTNGTKYTDVKHRPGGSAEYAVRLEAEARTVDWAPTCRCQDAGEPVPCVALDIFWGSGTLGVAAKHIGYPLAAIGIELRPEYARLSEHRVEREVPKWARPVKVRPPRAPKRPAAPVALHQPSLLEVAL